MSYEVTLLVFGILLFLLGVVGKIKAKEIEVGTSSVTARVVTTVIGVFLIVLSFNPDIPKTFLSSLTGRAIEAEKTVSDSIVQENEQERLEEEQRRKTEQARLEEKWRRKTEQAHLEEEWRREAEQARLEEEQRREAEQAPYYKKMSFGFNGCDVKFGDLKKGVSKDYMIRLATKAEAQGFTYHPSLEYGQLIIGDYPKRCKSPSNMSWLLYLKVN